MKAVVRDLTIDFANKLFLIVLTSVSFTFITLLVNVFFVVSEQAKEFNRFRETLASPDEVLAHMELFDMQALIQSAATSLMPITAFAIFLSVLVLPFVQYYFAARRGYEVGILRALGLSRGMAWVRMLLENTILAAIAFVSAFAIALGITSWFSRSVLGIDGEMLAAMAVSFGNANILRFEWLSALVTLAVAAINLIIVSGLCNIIILKNAPLKMLRTYK